MAKKRKAGKAKDPLEWFDKMSKEEHRRLAKYQLRRFRQIAKAREKAGLPPF